MLTMIPMMATMPTWASRDPKNSTMTSIMMILIAAMTCSGTSALSTSNSYLASLKQQPANGEAEHHVSFATYRSTAEYLNALSSPDASDCASIAMDSSQSTSWSEVTSTQESPPAAAMMPPHASASESTSMLDDGAEHQDAPDEWYGKSNPMAGWEGYQHPRWGGYLNNLGTKDSDNQQQQQQQQQQNSGNPAETGRGTPKSQSAWTRNKDRSNQRPSQPRPNTPQWSPAATNTQPDSQADLLNSTDDDVANPVFRQGKRSDYGNDARWGADVYLDSIGQ